MDRTLLNVTDSPRIPTSWGPNSTSAYTEAESTAPSEVARESFPLLANLTGKYSDDKAEVVSYSNGDESSRLSALNHTLSSLLNDTLLSQVSNRTEDSESLPDASVEYSDRDDYSGAGRPPDAGGGSVYLPGIGYVKPPNLTGFWAIATVDRGDEGGALWDAVGQGGALNISRSGGIHALNRSTWNPSHNYWNASDLGVSNITSVTDNFTTGFPGGYLSGYSTEHVIIASVLVTLLMIIIVVGNGLVVLAIAIDRNLKAVQNWFIASLAVSDLLVGLLIMPFSLANELMGYWYFGNILCELWLATDVLLCTASIMNLCLISLDRFWSITRAISYVKQRTKKRAIIMIALVWILSMIICFPPLVGWKRPQPMKYGRPLCVLSEDIGYVVYSTLGSFYVPLVVMVVVYFKIYLAARSRARRGLKKTSRQPVVDNGKSTSTTTNTTSFSTPTKDKEHKHLNIEKEFSSFDEACEEGSKEGSGPVSPAGLDGQQNSVHLTVPAQSLHVHPLDEKKKLLSDDTDSACESPVKNARKGHHRHIHFSEDTDSTSDSQSTRARVKFNGYKHAPRGRSSTEDNMTPLLEDSQLESDSQRDSDKYTPQNSKQDDVKPTDQAEDEHPQPTEGPSQQNQQVNNNDGKKKGIVLTPASFSRANIQVRKNKLEGREKHKRTIDDPERLKKKIARAKERRAFIVLGIIMVTFILCWLPFFSTYLISSITGASVPGLVFAVFFWAGYCNSALNPVTYTIFNRDFRQAFAKILFGRRTWS